MDSFSFDWACNDPHGDYWHNARACDRVGHGTQSRNFWRTNADCSGRMDFIRSSVSLFFEAPQWAGASKSLYPALVFLVSLIQRCGSTVTCTNDGHLA